MKLSKETKLKFWTRQLQDLSLPLSIKIKLSRMIKIVKDDVYKVDRCKAKLVDSILDRKNL